MQEVLQAAQGAGFVGFEGGDALVGLGQDALVFGEVGHRALRGLGGRRFPPPGVEGGGGGQPQQRLRPSAVPVEERPLTGLSVMRTTPVLVKSRPGVAAGLARVLA